jgi:hypothetical protein
MSFIDKLKPKRLFKADVPKLKEYIGKKVTIEGRPVVIETIVGNRFKKTFYEINGQHLIGMLRFHAQMEGDKSITEEQFQAFENMELDSEKLPEKRSILEMPKK